MYVSMHELATIHTGKGLFLFGRHFHFVGHWDADPPITPAVERQCRGGFRFHALHASAVVYRAICSHICVRLRGRRQLVEDAR
ncbi:hypothetical protein M405DRAFT_448151 [Rhizopogon salebrosus TDB-379]|nr:hypothetical protein M405DRAFT_448151 [Rhizopogon salebrosus TDB-379]